MQPLLRLLALLSATTLLGACSAAADDPPADHSTGEDAFTDDPVVSPNRTIWWPGQQQHDTGGKSFFDHAHGQTWNYSPGDKAGVAVRTPVRTLFAGDYVFL